MKILGADVQGKCIHLGDFQVTGGTILVTDPCYELGTWCQVQVKKAETGTWKGYLFRKTDPYVVENIKKEILEKETVIKNYTENPSADPGVSAMREMLIEHYKEQLEVYKNYDCANVSVLLAHHESIDPFTSFENEWGRVKGTAGVDSGQMAICGLDFWKTTPLDYEGEETIDPETGFKRRGSGGDYWNVCDITLDEKGPGGGVYKNGAIVSRSGFGDGSYEVFRLNYDRKVLGVAVVFIPDYDYED